MTTTKTKTAAPKRAAVARSEPKAPQAKSFEWRGLVFKLPAQLPATIAFDMAEIEDGGLGPLFGFLTRLLGKDQMQQVRDKLDADGDVLDDLDKILTELMDGALDPFGLGLGEASASPTS